MKINENWCIAARVRRMAAEKSDTISRKLKYIHFYFFHFSLFGSQLNQKMEQFSSFRVIYINWNWNNLPENFLYLYTHIL